LALRFEPDGPIDEEVRDAEGRWILREMGIVGLRIVHEPRGKPCLPLETCPSPKKANLRVPSFGRPVATLEAVREAVAEYVTRAAEKLRLQGSAAGAVTVFVMTNPFNPRDPQYGNSAVVDLPVATPATPELLRYALRVVDRIYRPGFHYKKAGVLLTGLVPADRVQPDLFDGADRVRNGVLMSVLDRVNAMIGPGTLRYAAAPGPRPAWGVRAAWRSPRFMTRWHEIPIVKVG